MFRETRTPKPNELMNNLLCRRFFPAAACVLLAIGGVAAQTSLPLSFGDALRQMQNGNRSLKIADKELKPPVRNVTN